jgi:hypothetical protein
MECKRSLMAAKPALVLITAFTVVSALSLGATAQTSQGATIPPKTDHGRERSEDARDAFGAAAYLGFFPRNSWLPYDVLSRDGEGLFDRQSAKDPGEDEPGNAGSPISVEERKWRKEILARPL